MLNRTPMRFRGVPMRRPLPVVQRTANPLDIVPLIDELRRMHAELMDKSALVEKALTTFEAVKKGDRGSAGMNGINGKNGKNVTAAEVEAAVRGMLVQPKDGQAPTVEDIAAEMLKTPKIFKFIQRQIKESIAASGKGTGDDAEEKDEMQTTKAMVETIVAKIRKEFEGKIAEVRNYAATRSGGELSRELAGKQYGKDTWARGGGDTVEAGSGIIIVETTNGRKRITSSGGAGFQTPTSGVVDGDNRTFVWAVAPKVIVADQGRGMQKVSSDLTENWTGTTTTVLAIAPTFDLYATA